VEVKHDRERRRTGNLFIEEHERASTTHAWHDADYLLHPRCWAPAIGDEGKVFVLSVKRLRRLYGSGRYKEVVNLSDTAVGPLLPVGVAERWSVFPLPRGRNMSWEWAAGATAGTSPR
jgi:hypothetical protein